LSIARVSGFATASAEASGLFNLIAAVATRLLLRKWCPARAAEAAFTLLSAITALDHVLSLGR
jgi:predicted membrane-bound spermidine synthase